MLSARLAVLLLEPKTNLVKLLQGVVALVCSNGIERKQGDSNHEHGSASHISP